MRRSVVTTLLLAVGFGSIASSVRAEITAEQVRQAIDKGVTYLKRRQKPDGTWPDWSFGVVGATYPGGTTSLCTLALLNAGVDPKDPVIQAALKQLRRMKPEKTYVTALQTMALCRAEPENDLLTIEANVRWLESHQVQGEPNKGAWSYPAPRSVSTGDPSNTQFALLALHEAERVGVNVSDQTWRLARRYWESRQDPLSGGWAYRDGARLTGSMTCAGIASLVITGEKVRSSDATAEGEQIRCCGGANDDDDVAIQRGLDWLGRNFSVRGNPGSAEYWWLYYLYGLERVGRLTAQRTIGGHDWYREGAELLVHKQIPLSGSWKGSGYAEDDELVGTSLALLFLAKGRRPLLMAKLEHSPPGDDWNQHRSDVANLTRYVEPRWKLDLTWQVVNLQAATTEDLLQAPVLFMCGQRSPWPIKPSVQKPLAQKLRDYLDRGGFLFAEAYGNGSQFDQGFRRLMEEVFPEKEYSLQLLHEDHPIWYAEEMVDPKYHRPLWGINFGCRTSVIYVAQDPPENPRPSLSCLWELSRGDRGQKFLPSVQARVDAALAIGINVLAYATNREVREKDPSLRPMTDPRPQDPIPRGQVTLAKLRHPGGCDAAPRALANLMEEASKQLDIRTGVRQELLDMTDEALFDYHMVFMHGRQRFNLLDAEREQLKAYVERGGILFADAICPGADPSQWAFTESFRREMKTIFGRELEPIPPDDPMLTDRYGGSDLRIVSRRDPQPRRADEPLKATIRKVPPELEGLKFGDRWGVIFSKYDISCALEKHDSLECRGYIRTDAARIGLNVLLYSLQQ